ncbi:MAG TPA: hypothetical protein DD420_04205 [Streptomyces sp.]|nr:hypothetical protein [Streptomyces sp.]
MFPPHQLPYPTETARLDVNSLDEKELKASLDQMPDALGHALEAAALGYPAGHPDGGVVRDADNAEVMQQVMEKYGADAKLLKAQEAMADSLGTMGAGYIDDINWALDKNKDESIFAPGKNPDGHMDLSDLEGGDGRSVARKFLSALGHHPDAYASVSAAEQLYTSSAMEAQVGADGDIDTGNVRRAVKIGSEVQGILNQSRADQIEATNLKTHEDYEKAAEKRAGWVEFSSTAALGAGVATAAFFLPAAPVIGAGALLVPMFTDTATGAAEQVMGDVLGGMGDKIIDENKEKVEELTPLRRKSCTQLVRCTRRRRSKTSSSGTKKRSTGWTQRRAARWKRTWTTRGSSVTGTGTSGRGSRASGRRPDLWAWRPREPRTAMDRRVERAECDTSEVGVHGCGNC